jgi:hypothetical protein
MTTPTGKSTLLSTLTYVVLSVAVVVGVDLLFFRDRFWERLIVKVGLSWRSRAANALGALRGVANMAEHA